MDTETANEFEGWSYNDVYHYKQRHPKPEKWLGTLVGKQLPGSYLTYVGRTGDKSKSGIAIHLATCACGKEVQAQASDLLPRPKRMLKGWHPVPTRTCGQCKYAELTGSNKLAATQATYDTLLTYLPNRANYTVDGFIQGGWNGGGKTVRPKVIIINPDGKEHKRDLHNTLNQLSGKQMIADRNKTKGNRDYDPDAVLDFVNAAYIPGKPIYCHYTGEQLWYPASRSWDLTPSLDRIIPNLGYVAGNLAICSYGINSLKSDLSLDQMKELATRTNPITKARLDALIARLEANPEMCYTPTLPPEFQFDEP